MGTFLCSEHALLEQMPSTVRAGHGQSADERGLGSELSAQSGSWAWPCDAARALAEMPMGVVSVQVRARLALPWGGGRAAGRKGQLEPGPDEWAGTGQAEQAGTAFQGQE